MRLFQYVTIKLENKITTDILLKNIIKLICNLYLIFGVVLWCICFINTDWKKMRILCCGNCDRIWYSEMWGYYEMYTIPFIVLTFPIRWITYDIENIKIWCIVSIYLPFIPCLILSLKNVVRRKR